MSRTPIRDAPCNQPRCRLSTGETCRIVDRWSKAERENVVRGLVPRWGRGGAWQNPLCKFFVPRHNSGTSYPGVPAPAGMSDWCENSWFPSSLRVLGTLASLVTPAPNSSFRRRPESRGEGWHQPHPNTSNDSASFSYLGVPAPAGMSDWNESMSRTPIRDHFRHRPATPTTVARTTTAQGPKRNVGLGLVPSQGWGGGAQMTPLNPPINQCTQFSYLGVPAVAGTSDCYERR